MNPVNSQICHQTLTGLCTLLLFWHHHQREWQWLHKEFKVNWHLTRGHYRWLGPEQPLNSNLHSSGIMLSPGCEADRTRYEVLWTRKEQWSSLGSLGRQRQPVWMMSGFITDQLQIYKAKFLKTEFGFTTLCHLRARKIQIFLERMPCQNWGGKSRGKHLRSLR